MKGLNLPIISFDALADEIIAGGDRAADNADSLVLINMARDVLEENKHRLEYLGPLLLTLINFNPSMDR